MILYKINIYICFKVNITIIIIKKKTGNFYYNLWIDENHTFIVYFRKKTLKLYLTHGRIPYHIWRINQYILGNYILRNFLRKYE